MTTAAERKARSEEICRCEGIPVNPNLPVVESEENVTLRTVEETAWRAMCLCVVALKGEGMPHDKILKVIDDYELKPHFSPLEIQFVFSEEIDQTERISFCWRYESYCVLLWALGWIDSLSFPAKICDLEIAIPILRDCGSSQNFIKGSSLRGISEILDQLDLTYRYDWACVEARLKGLSDPQPEQRSIIYERHYALNWLVKYFDQEWDDVTCDT